MQQIDLFLHALDTAPLGFCMVDAKNYNIHYANPDFGSILMIGQDIVGKSLAELMPESFVSYIFHHNLVSFEREMTVTRSNQEVR